ncbi:glycosyltransferase family 4 protein [Vibrio splendidus]|uniref:glycosyltransferase family 4 protein n=1 Tax=Vibrio splendidus TaxID=29497 RepID=UPI000C85F6FE|nr:glycosyltransferase family 4 protein [Vibrio splendidus]PMK11842.1 group 1 glycosyl transferase [Vibrio splendidus]
MKIALIHMRHANTGGTELFLNYLSRYLAEQGDEVYIICRTHVEPSHPNIKFVKLAGLAIGKSHRIWKFAKDVENHLNLHHYDFVYGLGKTWSHDMLRIGGGTRMHLVDTIRDGKPNLKDKVAIEIEQRSMKDGAYRHIVANSYKSAHEIQQAYKVQPEKISVIHNFVDTKRFDRERVSVDAEAFRNRLSIDWSKPIFLFLGTGYRRKGLSETLRAFSQLSIEANLLIVGRESNEEDYKQQAQSLGIAEKCHFLGSQTRPELFFSLVDCYVFPTHYEPFGFTAIEALSCGCPVITTEDCGAKEVMQPTVSTVIESGKNINALTEAMHYWAAKRGDLNLKKACRDLALTLDVEVMMEKNYQMILSIYKEKQK